MKPSHKSFEPDGNSQRMHDLFSAPKVCFHDQVNVG